MKKLFILIIVLALLVSCSSLKTEQETEKIDEPLVSPTETVIPQEEVKPITEEIPQIQEEIITEPLDVEPLPTESLETVLFGAEIKVSGIDGNYTMKCSMPFDEELLALAASQIIENTSDFFEGFTYSLQEDGSIILTAPASFSGDILSLEEVIAPFANSVITLPRKEVVTIEEPKVPAEASPEPVAPTVAEEPKAPQQEAPAEIAEPVVSEPSVEVVPPEPSFFDKALEFLKADIIFTLSLLVLLIGFIVLLVSIFKKPKHRVTAKTEEKPTEFSSDEDFLEQLLGGSSK